MERHTRAGTRRKLGPCPMGGRLETGGSYHAPSVTGETAEARVGGHAGATMVRWCVEGQRSMVTSVLAKLRPSVELRVIRPFGMAVSRRTGVCNRSRQNFG